MMHMLITVDIGNSTIGFGLFLETQREIVAVKKIPTTPGATAKKYHKTVVDLLTEGLVENKKKRPSLAQIQKLHAIDAVISSVVPSVNKPVLQALQSVCGKRPMMLDYKKESGLTFKVRHPERVGADRIANAAACLQRFKKPCAVVDFGSATTITILGKKNTFLGGTILPGLMLMQHSLSSGTAKLPRIEMRSPAAILGKDTEEAIASGIVYGTAGAVDTLVKGIEQELGYRLKLVLTGGLAPLMSPLIKRVHTTAPHLTFEGLRSVYYKSRACTL